MIKRVQKRNGQLEEFQIEKLKNSLEKACQQAGYSEDKIFQVKEEISSYILEQLENFETVDTKSMRTLILNKLMESYPEVFEAWKKYDQEVKKRED